MPFNSAEFIFVFLPAALLIYALCLRLLPRWSRLCLVAISAAFYASFSVRQALLFLIPSVVLNYGAARLLGALQERPRLQGACLSIAVGANILALAYFKYTLWAVGVVAPGSAVYQFAASIVAPLGVSFVTINQIGYLVEVKQGTAKVVDFLGYCVFAMFFCHVISGPILHVSEIHPQLPEHAGARLRWDDVTVGASWFVMGLFKKIVIADSITPWADSAFGQAHELSAVGVMLGAVAYSLQLYFDFSGYSDMAIGAARMFSIHYPLNFNSPLKATSIIEYWSRWHITLTRYITLFLYNPMSVAVSRRRAAQGKPISKRGAKTLSGFLSMVAAPTLLTVMIAGVWHGAGWTFLIFGVLHGIYLSVNNAWRIFKRPASLLCQVVSYRPVSMALTYGAACSAFIFFRADSVSDAFAMVASLGGAHGLIGAPGDGPALLAAIPASIVLAAPLVRLLGWIPVRAAVLGMLPIVWLLPNTQQLLGQDDGKLDYTGYWPDWLHWRSSVPWAVTVSMALVAAVCLIGRTSTFVYFKF